MKYRKARDGEWIAPILRGYRLACCDCGLVHVLDFRIVRRRRALAVEFRPFRHARATAAMRRRPQVCRKV